MSVQLINPRNSKPLRQQDTFLVDPSGNYFPIIQGVPRFTSDSNYADSFGIQWNRFPNTQLDREVGTHNISRLRFFAETRWDPQSLAGKQVLEVGSGAGRFSRVILQYTQATLYSVDYSDAVTANYRSNFSISPDRFHLFQASIYEMPFPSSSFDKVVCLGVLQHTPSFDSSIKCLINKAKPGAEIVVDFYPVNGWWTKLHAKYLLRPLTTRLSHQRLFRLIEANIDWLLTVEKCLHNLRLSLLARFLPLVDTYRTFPNYLSDVEKREWAILDTFDMFSPAYDNPQRIDQVVAMFERHGADVTFSGYETYGSSSAAVVRGIKRS